MAATQILLIEYGVYVRVREITQAKGGGSRYSWAFMWVMRFQRVEYNLPHGGRGDQFLRIFPP